MCAVIKKRRRRLPDTTVLAVHPQGKFADRLLLHGLDGRPVVTGHTVTVKVVGQKREKVSDEYLLLCLFETAFLNECDILKRIFEIYER